MPQPRIDEQSRRRGDFRADVPVVLADGQVWHLKKPSILVGRRKAEGATGYFTRSSFGPDYFEKIEAFYHASTEDDPEPYIAASFDLAIALLLQNYDLTEQEAEDLVLFDFNEPPDPVAAERRAVMLDTACGIQKKTSGAGSGATSSPQA